MTPTAPHGFDRWQPPLPVGYPPVPQVLPEGVPPAVDTLPQAWWAVARHPGRRTFAAWAGAADQTWLVLSLVVGFVLSAIAALLEATLPQWVTLNVATPQDATRLPFGIGAHDVTSTVSYVVRPVAFLVGVLAVAAALALFMPAVHGPFPARFARALKPWALAQPALAGVALLVQLVILGANGVVSMLYGSQLIVLTPPYDARVVLGTVVVSLLGLGLAVFLVVYSITLVVQSCAVGSGLRRWPVAGIALLGYMASGLVMAVLIGAITAIAIVAGAK